MPAQGQSVLSSLIHWLTRTSRNQDDDAGVRIVEEQLTDDQAGLDSLAQSDLVGENEPHDGIAGHPGQHVKLMLVGKHGADAAAVNPL